MFATVGDHGRGHLPATQRRGQRGERAVDELSVRPVTGGARWVPGFTNGLASTTPFLFEAACMVVAAVAVGRGLWSLPMRRARHRTGRTGACSQSSSCTGCHGDAGDSAVLMPFRPAP